MGEEAFLGPGVALGTRNIPNTFNVLVQLPPRPESNGGGSDETQEEIFRRKLEAIIGSEKPVHTGYDLEITYE